MSLGTVLRKVRRGWNDSSWWRSKFSLREGLMPAYFQLLDDPYNGVDVLAEDWDNLIILDACRYDLFEETHDFAYLLEKRRSRGASTPPFLRRNFGEETHYDTVYVTGNPMVNIILEPETQFHNVVNVWKFGWDESLGTVRPEQMAEATIEAYHEHPNKRIVSHFVQPHYPFIGEQALERLPTQRGFRRGRDELLTGSGEIGHDRVWKLLEEEAISQAEVWNLYRENLELALTSVKRLLDVFEEPTVVTSDHGNMVGEFAWPFPVRMYGHEATGIRRPELVSVPWLAVDGPTRKEVISEPPESDERDETVAQERLKALGYK